MNIALIMAGGSGTRFWPLSRARRPKQFLPLFGGKSLIAATADRVAPLVKDGIYVVSTEAQQSLLETHLPHVSKSHFFFEPEGRNTAPCLMYSLAELLRQGLSDDTVMFVLPADHFIRDEAGFRDVLATCARYAVKSGGLLTLGIVPESPHTGYGYIEAGATADGEILRVKRFVEKPTRGRAEEFLKFGGFFWNAGIFIWTLGALRDAFEKFLPEEWKLVRERRPSLDVYRKLSKAPIDTAVLERSESLFVHPASIGWSDIGSWDALHGLHAKTPDANVAASGRVAAIEAKGSIVHVPAGRKVTLVGVENLIVVEDGDNLLIASRAQDQLVKRAAEEDGS